MTARDAEDAPPAIPVLRSIGPLASTADAWLVDIWGVMHNGVRPFADAVAACRRFREDGGSVLLLSNSPRPAAGVAAQLDQIGVDRAAYDAVVSSGDATRGLIAELGQAGIVHIGPARDLPLFDGLPVHISEAATAAAVVCTGLVDDTSETPDDYTAALETLARHGLPMLCANPDIKVERGGSVIWCAGALARVYAERCGTVLYAGKPHPAIYELAFAALARLRGGPVARARMLVIGDGIETDIAGAAANGIRSVYVASPVHLPVSALLDAAALATLFPARERRPVAAMTALAW
ncbi:MAG: TIGR01459 family HAD-type hydrolase [Hyphomicrobiaceae bacterium]|nr:TIGR01459 family HAD-type hydrolase [Hyphomicrobiaceae bacterium]